MLKSLTLCNQELNGLIVMLKLRQYSGYVDKKGYKYELQVAGR